MDFEEYRKQFPATRCFQHYTVEQRTNHAASHRLTGNQRNAVGEFFYAHNHAPGLAFPKRRQAERAGFERYQPQQREPQGACASGSPGIHLTYTGPLAGKTLCGAARGDGKAHHAVYAPVQTPDYRALCCQACLRIFARAWTGTRTKPEWVLAVLSNDIPDAVADQLSLFPLNGDSHAI